MSISCGSCQEFMLWKNKKEIRGLCEAYDDSTYPSNTHAATCSRYKKAKNVKKRIIY